MITTEEQALSVQFDRMLNGKKGTAKAVRRFYIRKFHGATSRAWNQGIRHLPANFEGCAAYDWKGERA